MPIWAFLEVMTFGTLLAFYLFCSRRWDDGVMRGEHYILKGVKTVRNCCSHSLCAFAHNECAVASLSALTLLRT